MPQYRINGTDEAVLILTALFFDGLSLVPFLGIITTPVGQFLLWLMFFLNGVSVWGWRAVYMFLGSVSEIFPLTSWVPALTVQTLLMIWSSRAEDRRKATRAKA